MVKKQLCVNESDCDCCPYINRASAEGIYTLNTGDEERKVNDSVCLRTDCISAKLSKTADRSYISPGDVINYTVKLTNCSTVDFYDVIISDVISDKTTLVEDSVSPAPKTGETLETGINLGRLAIGKSKNLQFSVTVNDDAQGDIENSSEANFLFRDSEDQEISLSASSPSATVTIVNPSINITKTSDKNYITSDGDEVTYTITVQNSGDVTIDDILVVDNIPSGMTYKKRSTLRNGKRPYTSDDPSKGIQIGSLASGESYEIQFTVVVGQN